jgi:hypothetical protein
VPSYATAIGSSADRPLALAELMGIIVNDGQRRPTEAERNAARRALELYMSELREEIGRTEKHEWRESLRLESEILERVIEQLSPSPLSTVTRSLQCAGTPRRTR